MAINGSGVRGDTDRVLRISPTTVIAVLKKSRRAATRQPRTSTPPQELSRVEALKFGAGRVRGTAPLDGGFGCVPVSFPRRDFRLHGRLSGQPSLETLPG